MNLQELNELDLNNIGDWPGLLKVLLTVIICVGLGVGWYYFDTEDQLVQLKRVEQDEQNLRETFEKKQAKAVNLEKYEKQLEEMKQSFGAMLRQLPDKTEVAELLVDVSQTGLAAGLEFELFDPLGENRKDFYAELPIKIKVVGKYHQFGDFISGIATLPRIVTMHDITITSTNEQRLEMEAVAKTYRYLDEESGQ